MTEHPTDRELPIEGQTPALLEHTADCITVLDLEGRVIAMNGPGLSATGIEDFGRLRDKPWAGIWPNAARGSIEASIAAARRGQITRFAAARPTAAGVPKLWEVTVAPILAADASVERLLSISKDVTKSLQQRQALVAEEVADVGTFEMDLSERVVRGSPFFLSLYGRPADCPGIAYDVWLQHVHPDDRASHSLNFDAALAEKDRFTSEFRIRRDNEIRWISSRITIERDSAGRATRVRGIQQDLTERKRNELLWQALLGSIPDGLIISDEMGTITSASDTACHLFGYDQGELLGLNLKVLMPGAHAHRHDGWLERYRQTGERRAIGQINLLTPIRKDGTGFPAEISIGEANIDGQLTFFGFVRDISERRAAESKLGLLQGELEKAARLGSVGQLAASIAHELNQPLAAISNFSAAAAKLVEAERTAEPVFRNTLNGIHEQAQRAGTIIRALRAFVSRSPAQHTPFKLTDVIAEAVALATIGDGAAVLLSIDCPPSLVVNAERAQVQLLIFNLVRNAVEALVASEVKEISIRAWADAGTARVDVADGGPGLPDDPNFDPFELFASTKPEGMGVGLALCRTIAEANGGRIWYTRRSYGATFSFTLRTPQAS